jgi:hypothetical protein
MSRRHRQAEAEISLPVVIRYVRAPHGHSFAEGVEALRAIARRLAPLITPTNSQPEEALPCPS